MSDASQLGSWWTTAAVAATAVLAGFALAFASLNRNVVDQEVAVGAAVYALATSGIGLLVTRAGVSPVGRVYVGGAALAAMSAAAAGYASFGLEPGRAALPGTAWLVGPVLLLFPALALPMVLGSLYAPTGQLPEGRIRWIVVIAVCAAAAFVLSSIVRPGPIPEFGLDENPYGIDAFEALAEPLTGLSILATLGCLAAVIANLFRRARRATGVVRGQLRVMTIGLILAGVAVAAAQFAGVPPGWHVAGLALVPASTAIAVVGFGLWDADLLISRAVIYFVVSMVLIVIYIGAVVSLGAGLGTRTSFGSALIATACVTVAFEPVRRVVQRHVERWLFGRRDDPYAVVLRVDAGLRSAPAGEALQVLVDGIAQTLRLPYVKIRLLDEPGTTATHGVSRLSSTVVIPVSDGVTAVGELEIEPRSARERLNEEERVLLEHLALQAGTLVRGQQLATSLRAANESLIESRQAERQKLRRDLHDTVGPNLAAVLLRLRDASDSLEDPQTARPLLQRATEVTRATVDEVRRLARDLHPTDIATQNLVGATRLLADKLSTTELPIEVCETGDLAAVPPAVSAAIFQIASEALTNVVRHSGATTCTVDLSQGPAGVVLAVVDDGRGIASQPTEGVGLRSMRQRAEELGGTWSVERRAERGTIVRAAFATAP